MPSAPDRPALTAEEARILEERRRHAADLIHDQQTEARIYPQKINRHDD